MKKQDKKWMKIMNELPTGLAIFNKNKDITYINN